MRKLTYRILLLIVLLPFTTLAQQIENVDIKPSANGYVIAIEFVAPIQYQSHAPLDQGDSINIVLQNSSNAGYVNSAVNSNAMVWAKHLAPELEDMRFDTNEALPTLQLYFSQSVSFEVVAGKDQRSVVIDVKVPKAKSQSVASTSLDLKALIADLKKEDEELGKLLEEAISLFLKQNYSQSIRLLTKVQANTTSVIRQTVHEIIGVARELNGQRAQAKAEYERYIETYSTTADEGPAESANSEALARVRQRLDGLLTATQKPKQRLRSVSKSRTPQPDEWSSQTYGSVAQTYYRYQISPDNSDSITIRSDLINDLDFVMKAKKGEVSLKTQFVGSYREDFLDDGAGSEFNPSLLLLEAEHKGWGADAKIGRQTLSSGGVLGRFDGARAGYFLSDSIKLNAVVGFPVSFSNKSSINTDIQFSGVNVDFLSLFDAIDANLYYFTQDNQGMTDREAVGGELRYRSDNLTLFTLADYDVQFSELNLLMMIGNWRVNENTSINFNADYRNSPILTARNAIIGQGVETLEELYAIYTSAEIYQLALDRTARSQMVSVGVSHQFSSQWQVIADITQSKFGSTPDSGGVFGFAGTDNEWTYSAQLIGNQLWQESDTLMLNVRYADTTFNDVYSYSASWRFNLSPEFRLNPRLRIDQRSSKTSDSTRWLYRPYLRLDYRYERWLKVEFDIGYEYSDEQADLFNTTSSGFFVSLGYRALF